MAHNESNGNDGKSGFRITSIIITVVMIVSSLGIMVAIPSATVSAFPTSNPQASEYLFYDDFETDLANWTIVSGEAVLSLSTNNHTHGLKSVRFLETDPWKEEIKKSFPEEKNQNVIVEVNMTDNPTYDLQGVSELFVGNVTDTIGLGVRATTATWYNVQTTSLLCGQNLERSMGWHNLKIYLAGGKAVTFIDNIELSTFNLTAPTEYGLRNNHGYGDYEAYFDEFILYEQYRDPIWERPSGTNPVIKTNASWKTKAVAEPNVIYVDGIYKMWYRGLNSTEFYGLGYATSEDGLTWTADPSYQYDLNGYCPSVFKYGSTYYLYWAWGTTGGIARATSPDGISWSAPTGVMLKGTPPAWDSSDMGNNYVWIENGAWYMIYEAKAAGTSWHLGLATSPDGLTWTKYSGNPITDWFCSQGGPQVVKVYSIYYMFYHYNHRTATSTEIGLLQSPDLIHWTEVMFHEQLTRDMDAGGIKYESIQVADPWYISTADGNFLYYTTSSDGVNGNISVATSIYSLSEIIQSQILQWGKQWIGNIGVTNSITAPSSRTYWYSGINAMKGTYFYDWNVTWNLGSLNMTINQWSPSSSGTVASWVTGPGSSNAVVTFTLSGLDSGVGYKVYVDGVLYYQQLKGLTDLTFTYSGPWSEHSFEVVAWDFTPGSSLQASFEYTVDGPLVSFTDKSYGGAVVWVWNFGDGAGSTAQSPTHKYIASGKYTVSLTVYDSDGYSSKASTEVELKLGPDFPIERNPNGWDIFITDDLTVSLSAIGLLVIGAITYVSAIFMPYFPVITPKGRKLIGGLMVLAGLYFLIFIDNSWMRF